MNDILFFGGIGTAAAALVAGLIIFFSHRAGKIRLERILDNEYGSADKASRKSKRSE